MSIFLTGASGFVGKNFIFTLIIHTKFVLIRGENNILIKEEIVIILQVRPMT